MSSQGLSIQCTFNPIERIVFDEIILPSYRVQSGALLKENTPAQVKQATIYRRAYTAFQLRDLSNEVPLSTISSRYRIPRGSVQSLAQQCHGFAAGIVKFCQRMGWGMLAAVLDHMRDRLEAGARADLLEMAQVTFVKSWTARLLRENGFRNLRALAAADPKDLAPILMMVGYCWRVAAVVFKLLLRTISRSIPIKHVRASYIPGKLNGTLSSCSRKQKSLLRLRIKFGVCVVRIRLVMSYLSIASSTNGIAERENQVELEE